MYDGRQIENNNDDQVVTQCLELNELPEDLPVLNNDPLLVVQNDEIRQNLDEGKLDEAKILL